MSSWLCPAQCVQLCIRYPMELGSTVARDIVRAIKLALGTSRGSSMLGSSPCSTSQLIAASRVFVPEKCNARTALQQQRVMYCSDASDSLADNTQGCLLADRQRRGGWSHFPITTNIQVEHPVMMAVCWRNALITYSFLAEDRQVPLMSQGLLVG